MEENSNHKSVFSTSNIDAFVAALLILIGAVVMVDSYRIGAGWADDGPQSGTFPFYVGLFIVISSAVTLCQAVFGKNKNTEPFVEREQFKMVLAVLIPTTVYILAIQFIGIYAASVIYIAVFMAWQGKYGWKMFVPVSLGVAVFFFLMFEVGFKVPLPKNELVDEKLLSFINTLLK